MNGLPPVETTRTELLDAWRAWDQASSSAADPSVEHHHGRNGLLEEVARKAEVAFGNHAARLGLQTTPFRDLCASWLRAGLSREEALTAIEAGLVASREVTP